MKLESTFYNEYLESLIERSKAGPKHASPGEWHAMAAYRYTNEHGFGTLTAERLPMERDEVIDFLNTLGSAGITEFILAETSTALMRYLHILLGAGWRITDTFECRVSPYVTVEGLLMEQE